MPPIEITNPKLESLEPRWSRFRGFSLLFENPDDEPGRALYRALEDGIAERAGDPLVAKLGLCALPPESCHVTAWDGVNDGNLPQVVPEYRAAWAAFLHAIPHPPFPDDLFREIRASVLLACPDWNIRLRCEQIENWNNVSLVARLGPADAGSAVALQRLADARTELSQAHDAKFGVQPYPDYTAHITLGYFANAALAAESAEAVARWNAALLERTADHLLAFHRIRPSIFTDMASFGRDDS